MKNIIKKNYAPPCELCDSRENSVFCVLNQTELESLTQHKTHFHLKKGQTIFYEGGNVQGLYCIYSGKVLIHKHNDTREQVVRMAKPGDWIGYRALLSEDKYSASATALEDVQVCFIPKQVFITLLNENSTFALKTIKLLANNLKYAEHILTNMVHKQANGRIADALLTLSDFYGFDDDGITIKANLSRENLAGIAGVTTETAIRVLSLLNKNKLVKLQGKRIRLLDKAKLKALANYPLPHS